MSSSEQPPAAGPRDEAPDGTSSLADDRAASISRWFRILVAGSSVLWLIGAAVVFSDLIIDLMAALLLIGSGFVIGLAWVVWSLLLYNKAATLRSRWRVAEWAFVPLAGLLGAALLATDRDNLLRFRLSEPALVRCLAEPRPGRQDDPSGEKGRRVGLFWFRSIHDQDGGVEFENGFTYPPSGLIYSPAGPPRPATPEHVYWHLSGPWWRYAQYY